MRIPRLVLTAFACLLFPQALRAAEPVSLLVLDLEDATGGRLSADELRTAGEAMVAELTRFPGYRVVSRRDVADLLNADTMKMLVGCDRAECLAPISQAVGAERMLAGSIGRLGKRSYVQLRLLDMRNASVLRRVSHLATQAELLQDVRAAIGQLMQVTAQVHLINQVPGAEVYLAGARVGEMPLKPFAAEQTGEVDLEISHVDYLPYRARLDLRPGQTTQHLLHLQSYSELERAAEVRSGVGYGLLAAAALCYGAGGYFFWKAFDHHDDYQALDPRRTSQAEYDMWQRRVEEQSAYGWVGMGVGTALLGVSLWLLLDNPYADALHAADAGSFALVPTPGGLAASVQASF
ncbi:MAG TPA: hypothetical protein PK668_06035 [Myxococcota bacterium]|nr:hypothetical protein [Myxococcota bacterium]HRY92599.1 hypothetical protein [Myxococcota bacterium]HSA24854.1 hypothetical protein [Myxococcota bacterium]